MNKVTLLRIRFQGKEYLLVNDDLQMEGPIATEEQWRTGACPYAHLFKDGQIKRYNKVIGTVQDIEVISPVALTMGDKEQMTAILNVMFPDEPWRPPPGEDPQVPPEPPRPA